MQAILDFPGGSRVKVNMAGNNVRKGTATPIDFQIINEWREAHSYVLNTFQSILRSKTRGKNIVVAQRHKRKKTILDKLLRYPKMQLSRMDDVAGCRLIFPNLNELYSFRAAFHKARFKHKRKNEADKYDYIFHPKNTGYRGIHDIYEYNVSSKKGQHLAGLLIEIQYRTNVQHAWATAVELIGFLTESQPKFQKGDKRYEKIMMLASEILSRSFENKIGPLSEMNGKSIVAEFNKLDADLGLMKKLKGLNAANQKILLKWNTILNISNENKLQIHSFRSDADALKKLFELEKDLPSNDIVLVKADSSDAVRLAYKNYFSDARDFVDLVKKGCRNLQDVEN